MSADNCTHPPGLVSEIFSNPADWMVDIERLKPFGVLRICPPGHLTIKSIMEALKAQKLLHDGAGQLRYWLIDHGTVILIQRKGN